MYCKIFAFLFLTMHAFAEPSMNKKRSLHDPLNYTNNMNNNNNQVYTNTGHPDNTPVMTNTHLQNIPMYHRPYGIPINGPLPSAIVGSKPFSVDVQRPYQLEKPITVKGPMSYTMRQPVIQRVPYPVPVDRPYPVPVPRHIVVERQIPVYVNPGMSNTVYMGESGFEGYNVIYHPNDLNNNNLFYNQLQLQNNQQQMQTLPMLGSGHSDSPTYQHHMTIHH